MLPFATNSSSSVNRDQNPNVTGSARRYSLFGLTTSPPIGATSLANLFNSNSSNDSYCPSNDRSGTMSGPVCPRCKHYQVNLTNTSDHLSATDAELKASRQVISLLQRQLELFRVEKEGLEGLIISQSNNPFKANGSNNSQTGESTETDLLQFVDPTASNTETERNNDAGDKQTVLLNLIRTQLYAKDEELVKLRFNLKEVQNDKERLTLQVHQLEEDNAKLKSENSVLKENLALRDQTIVSLSNEVFEQGVVSSQNHRRQSSFENFGSQQSLMRAERQITKLMDTIDAYKKTNELLSDNVSKLTDKCSETEKREIEARSQSHELEAKCCQIQSKLLALLKEIESSSKQSADDATAKPEEVNCSESVKLLIKRLLEDKSLDIPLSWKEGNKSSRDNENKALNPKYECDELGFYIVVEEAQEYPRSCNDSSPTIEARSPMKRHSLGILESRPSASSSSSVLRLPIVEEAVEVKGQEDFNQIRQNILRQTSVDSTKTHEPRWHIKWDYFIKDFDKVDLGKSKEFKQLLRSGVPQEYRCKIWKALVNLKIGETRKRYGQDYYQSLLEPNRPQCSSNKMNPSSKQIELDLLRTLPNNRHFETLSSSGTVRLRRVLTAYSEHNPKVGYCQGMNRLAAVALLVVPEEEAFWCLSTIVDIIMPDGYYNDLWLAQVDSSVVMDFVAIKMPQLSNHFRQYGIELSLFAWFLTIFVDGTPPALFLRLWDSFLFEGDKVLFRVALALLKMNEPQLMELNNSVAINNYLRSSVNAPMDIDRFFDIAFQWINPLSSKSLKAKRQQNLQIMKSGFERAANLFVSPSPDDKAQDQSRYDDSPDEDPSMISI